MDFGKVSNIEEVDFSLPADHPENIKILRENKKRNNAKPKVYVGCAKWGREEWVGKLYPKGTKQGDYLKYYAKSFNSIELNAVFYRIPPDSWIKKWKGFTEEGFKFCPKINRSISHIRRLKDAERVTDIYLERMSEFGDRLGAMFLQLPQNFTPKKYDVFEDYIRSFPKDFPLTVEFRHPGFFEENNIADQTYQMMQEQGIGTVITDTAGRRDVCHMRLTTPMAFIRFVGNSLHPTDYSRIDDWVERIKEWLDNGLDTLYFFMHHHDERYSPELSTYLIQKLNKACSLSLKEPEWVGEPEKP